VNGSRENIKNNFVALIQKALEATTFKASEQTCWRSKTKQTAAAKRIRKLGKKPRDTDQMCL
jgi:hypothetical protein